MGRVALDMRAGHLSKHQDVARYHHSYCHHTHRDAHDHHERAAFIAPQIPPDLSEGGAHLWPFPLSNRSPSSTSTTRGMRLASPRSCVTIMKVLPPLTSSSNRQKTLSADLLSR